MRRWQTWLVVALVSFGIVAVGPVEAREAGDRPRSYRERRYEGVVGQTDWSTCGPAALATYLTSFVGRATTEAEIIALTAELRRERTGVSGTSMLQLKEALEALGVLARGYRVDVDELAAYFEQGGPPLILHVTQPRLHYVVAVGLTKRTGGEYLALADPSYGRRLIPLPEIRDRFGFLGNVLAPLPAEPVLAHVKARQAEWIRQESRRLAQLEAARR